MMSTKTFGTTGFDVTPLCIGTSSWGPKRAGESAEQGDARVGALADAFFDGSLGSNFIDTSNIYGDSESEVFVGQAMSRAGGLGPNRVLQTKLDRDTRNGDFDAEQMWRSLDQSLTRLGVDRLQVLYLHDPENIGFEAAMAEGGPVSALLEMKRQGLAVSIGISGGPVGMLQRFVETGLFDALVTHNRFTLVDRSADALLAASAARGLGVTNAAPFGAGVLTGDPRFAGSYGYAPIRPAVRASVEAMSAACESFGVPLAAAALQFSMREPRIHSTIVGASSLDRARESLDWAAAVVPDGLWPVLESLVPAAGEWLDASGRPGA